MKMVKKLNTSDNEHHTLDMAILLNGVGDHSSSNFVEVGIVKKSHENIKNPQLHYLVHLFSFRKIIFFSSLDRRKFNKLKC